MAKPTISEQVDRYTVISSTGIDTAQPGPVVRQDVFPAGDKGIALVHVRTNGLIDVAGGSTPVRVADGEKIFLRSLSLETDKHKRIVNNVDGLLLYRMLTYEWGVPPDFAQVASTPADEDPFHCSWPIPVTLHKGFRPYDTILDVLKAKAVLTTQYGIRSDIFGYTGGTPLVKSVIQSLETKTLPGPLNMGRDAEGKAAPEFSELPIYKRTFEMATWPISQTANRYKIPLPFGDRIYRRIFITQRNGSDRSELATVIVPTAEVEMEVNGVPIHRRRIFQDIRSLNAAQYRLTSAQLPTGVAVLDFDADDQERINDMLWTLTTDAGNANLYIDVTAVSNGQIWLGFDCLEPVPAAALR